LKEDRLKERKAQARKILSRLKGLFPDAKMVLNYKTNWELLVAVILSAQCTDVMVNRVTVTLFKKYKKLEDYANAKQCDLEQDIRSTGFYRNKARNIIAAAKKIKKDFNNKIPRTMGEMLTIPGVARKTANVVLGSVFGIVEGIAVDTHVKRFARKFNLTDHKDPNKIEQDLMEILPKRDWFCTTHLFIEYGRQICPARKHDCSGHPLTKVYPLAADIWPSPK